MTTEEELLQFSKDWDKAMVSNDVAEIGKFMSDDWVIIGTEGGITSKASFLEWIRSGDVSHHTMDSDEVRVRVYGHAGMITARGTSAGKYKGTDFTLYEWSTSVFIRKGEQWLCELTMLTPANKSKDPAL
jgi:ketosteroid isomerase-like protein